MRPVRRSGICFPRCFTLSTPPPGRIVFLIHQVIDGNAGRGQPQQTRAETGFGLTRQAGREWLQGLLSRFGPMNDKASNAYVLDFEKPLVELDNRIKEVGAAAAWQARMLKIRCQKKLVVKLVVRRTAH